ncbi:MAG: SRPBCC domain-containing protein [Flavobacteriales bacterium]
MKTTTFKQELTVNLPAQTIYDMYMDSKKHSKLISSPAVIGKKVGAAFKVYDGYAFGKNLELVPGKKIVQTWRAKEDKWPEGLDSIVEFTFKSLGKNKTKITLKHKNVPTVLATNFKNGWKDFYWTPLKKMTFK